MKKATPLQSRQTNDTKHNTKDLAINRWVEILTKLGIDSALLDGNSHAYPEIGCTTDGFRYIDKAGDGYCSLGHGEFGDGFGFLSKLYGWDFKKAASEIDMAMGWSNSEYKPPSKDELANIKAEHDRAARKREETVIETHTVAAKACLDSWGSASIAESHAYLNGVKKFTNDMIKPLGLRIAKDGRLIVPASINSEISTLQYISDAGKKEFVTGAKKKGASFTIGDIEGRAVVVEGLATGIAVYDALGVAVVVAFDVGNIRPVVEQLLADGVEVLVCGDHDASGAGERLGSIAGAKFSMPAAVGDDWYDVWLNLGREACAASIKEACAASDEWETPEPFETFDDSAPLFTQDCLPPLMWLMSEEAAAIAGSTNVYAVPSVLTAVCKALRGKMSVTKHEERGFEPVTLYIANIAVSGDGKSATVKALESNELTSYLEERAQEALLLFVEWKDTADLLADEKTSLMKMRVKTDEDKMKRSTGLTKVNRELVKHRAIRPRAPITIVSSATHESICKAAGEFEYVMCETDEGSQILEGIGAYSKSVSEAMNVHLLGYDGAKAKHSRVSGDYGGHLVEGMNLAIQPIVAETILSDVVMSGRGLVQRIFWLAAKPSLPCDHNHIHIRDKALIANWNEAILGLTKTIDARHEPLEVVCDNDALRIINTYGNELSAKIYNSELDGLETLFKRRFVGQVTRVAGVYHAFSCFMDGIALDSRITGATANYAVETCKVLEKHRVMLHRKASAGGFHTQAHMLIQKLAKAKIKRITVRTLSRKCWGNGVSENAEKLLNQLCELGWAKLVAETKTLGRKKSPRYTMHPEYEKHVSDGERVLTELTKLTKVPNQGEKGGEKSSSVSLGSIVSTPFTSQQVFSESELKPKTVVKDTFFKPSVISKATGEFEQKKYVGKAGELGADGKIIRAETVEEKDDKVEAKKPHRRGSL